MAHQFFACVEGFRNFQGYFYFLELNYISFSLYIGRIVNFK